jgi:Family of unknown function (DUF6152)
MKNKLLVVLGSLGVCFLVCSPLFAHHGFAGRYDEANPITITGTVVELQLINPHSQIIFEVKGPKGEIQRWHAELGGANAVHREGWDKNTVKPGTRITILGPAAKSGTFDMNLSHESRITLTDTGRVLHDSIATGNANAPGRGAAGAPPAQSAY